ncbi:uncharacterized protein [Cicer arietinum]|uniref:uncharacterized protein isoform X1 n=1 Tax=Cicer arietinum TaxID=3827 RepID=UPI003CC55E93
MIRRFPETSHLHRQKRFNPINYPHSKPAAAPQLDIRGKNKAGKLKKLEGNKAGKLQKMEGNKVAKVAGQKLDRGKSVVAPAPKISLSCLARYGSCLDIQVKTNWGSNNGSRIISMDKAIFRYEYEELLEKEHIYELLNHKELSATVISLYIRTHWMLFAINATSEVIYYLNPLHYNYNNHSDIKNMFDTALQVFRAQRGATASKQKSNNITWFPIKAKSRYTKTTLQLKEEKK